MKTSAASLRKATPRQRPSEGAKHGAWLRLGLVVLGGLGFAAAWKWTPLAEVLDPDALSAWAAPYRHAWFAIPATIAAYVVLGFILVPVLLMILVTGLVFGPWIGVPCALGGCLASAAAGFGAGRLLGRDTVERLGGATAQKISKGLEKNGILAVFLVRKVPAPFTLVNIVAGASPVRFRDFLIGTFLGMGSMVVLVSVLGWQLLETARKPSAASIAGSIGLTLLMLGIAFGLQVLLRRKKRVA